MPRIMARWCINVPWKTPGGPSLQTAGFAEGYIFLFLRVFLLHVVGWIGDDILPRHIGIIINHEILVGGFKYVLCSSLPGKMIQFDEHIFRMG